MHSQSCTSPLLQRNLMVQFLYHFESTNSKYKNATQQYDTMHYRKPFFFKGMPQVFTSVRIMLWAREILKLDKDMRCRSSAQYSLIKQLNSLICHNIMAQFILFTYEHWHVACSPQHWQRQALKGSIICCLVYYNAEQWNCQLTCLSEANSRK